MAIDSSSFPKPYQSSKREILICSYSGGIDICSPLLSNYRMATSYPPDFACVKRHHLTNILIKDVNIWLGFHIFMFHPNLKIFINLNPYCYKSQWALTKRILIKFEMPKKDRSSPFQLQTNKEESISFSVLPSNKTMFESEIWVKIKKACLKGWRTCFGSIRSNAYSQKTEIFDAIYFMERRGIRSWCFCSILPRPERGVGA